MSALVRRVTSDDVGAQARGTGVGEALVTAAVAVGRDRGASHVRWFTALDDRRAQRRYERVGAERTAWLEYEIALHGASDFSAQ